MNINAQNEFESSKQDLIKRNRSLRALIESESASGNNFAEVCEVISQYLSLQSKDFYALLRLRHSGDISALKRIVYFENDLNQIRVQLYSLPDFNSKNTPVYKKAIYIKTIQQFLADFDIRLDLEQKFLFPILVNTQAMVAK